MASKRETKKSRMGGLPPRYSFVLNPHADTRFTSCPTCEAKTRIRKLALVVHVESVGLVMLGKTCRLCIACDLLIAHEDDVERVLRALLPSVQAGTLTYLVLGTVDVREWRRGLAGVASLDDVREHMADFKRYLRVDVIPRRRYPKTGAPP